MVRSVDLRVAANCGFVAHEVIAFDQHIGRGKGNAPAARRIDCEEADVSPLVRHRLHRFARGVEDDLFDLDAEAPGELVGQIDRDAEWLPRGGVLVDEDGIAEVDRRP